MRATRALIDLEAIRHNAQFLRELSLANDPPPALCPSVKANAYGHGVVPVAQTLAEAGAESLAIATVSEGVVLREAGLRVPLLLYGIADPSEMAELVTHGLSPAVGDAEYAEQLAAACRSAGLKIRVHLWVDTGMTRVGCAPEELLSLADSVSAHPELEIAGVGSHFARADEEATETTQTQLQRFLRAAGDMSEAGHRGMVLHIANSGGILQAPRSHLQMMRTGIATYGIAPDPALAGRAALRPAMRLVSRLALRRRVSAGTAVSYGGTWIAPEDTWIGLVPAGYADGIPRALSNRGEVLVEGPERPRRVSIAGRVCMDQFMVDLGPGRPPDRWSEVTLMGGELAPSAQEIASVVGTIPYEILTGISARVPRVHLPIAEPG